MRCRRARPTPASPIPPLATPTDSLPPPTATVSVVPVETALPVSLSATPPRAPIPFARDSPNHHQRLQHRPLHSTRIHMLTRGGINMCVCTRGYQTSHARAITNVGRSQLHRFIAVTADLRVAVIKTKKKKKKGRKRGRREQIEITAAGYRKDGDYRRLNEKPDTLWDFQRETYAISCLLRKIRFLFDL